MTYEDCPYEFVFPMCVVNPDTFIARILGEVGNEFRYLPI